MSDTSNVSKAQIIDERKANLPLPEEPPVASDFNSADSSIVDVSSGQVDQAASRATDEQPATGESAVRTDGETFKTATAGQGVGRESEEGLDGIPNDAVTRDAKNKSGLADTTGKDYGYPKNDPSSGLQ